MMKNKIIISALLALLVSQNAFGRVTAVERILTAARSRVGGPMTPTRAGDARTYYHQTSPRIVVPRTPGSTLSGFQIFKCVLARLCRILGHPRGNGRF